jgi:hypothetical protein
LQRGICHDEPAPQSCKLLEALELVAGLQQWPLGRVCDIAVCVREILSFGKLRCDRRPFCNANTSLTELWPRSSQSMAEARTHRKLVPWSNSVAETFC